MEVEEIEEGERIIIWKRGGRWSGTRNGDREDGGEGAGGPRAEKEGGRSRPGREVGVREV